MSYFQLVGTVVTVKAGQMEQAVTFFKSIGFFVSNHELPEQSLNTRQQAAKKERLAKVLEKPVIMHTGFEARGPYLLLVESAANSLDINTGPVFFAVDSLTSAKRFIVASTKADKVLFGWNILLTRPRRNTLQVDLPDVLHHSLILKPTSVYILPQDLEDYHHRLLS